MGTECYQLVPVSLQSSDFKWRLENIQVTELVQNVLRATWATVNRKYILHKGGKRLIQIKYFLHCILVNRINKRFHFLSKRKNLYHCIKIMKINTVFTKHIKLGSREIFILADKASVYL